MSGATKTDRPVAKPSLGKRMRGAARVVGIRRVLKAAVGALGFDLVKRHFYSPVPDFAGLDDAYWERESELTGLDFDLDAQLGFIERDLAPHIAEFQPPRDPQPEPGFYLDNGTYGPVDADLLYGIVRHNKPKRVIEIGSGFSSLVIGEALEKNRAEGAEGRYEIIDPYPASASYEMGGEEALRRVSDLRVESILDVPAAEFDAMEAGDVLFVDATHTVKVGSDVNRMILDVVPRLAPGVTVHFHDVFLPREYPRDWVEGSEWYWAEQYLLQAFLAFNDSFEILAAANALSRDRPEKLKELIPSSGSGDPPLAMWIRRT
jgi:predicted O-methyltransferase YrrM